MMTKREPYSAQYKPVFEPDLPRLSDLVSQTFLSAQHETYDESGAPRLHSRRIQDDEEANDVYRLHLNDSGLTPIMREVDVEGKQMDHSFLLELQDNDEGLLVMLLSKESDILAYANIYLLPHSKVSDITRSSSGKRMKIKIPKRELLKVKVTLKVNFVGEIEYKTHEASAVFEDMTEGEQQKVKRALNLEIAPKIAEIAKQLIFDVDFEHAMNFTKLNATADELIRCSCFSKKCFVALGQVAGLVATAAAPLVSAWMGPAAGGIVGALGGGIRGLLGLIVPFCSKVPMNVGDTYYANGESYNFQAQATSVSASSVAVDEEIARATFPGAIKRRGSVTSW